ncbi:MAG: 50S ribosomal protein L24 [Nitrospirae bacterium]|nr:50S ribosomal protein L24 [Nitrospirota bacterium]
MEALKVHIKKNDSVLVLSGKDRGKRGRVLAVSPKKGTALVERLNLIKRHTRPNPRQKQGGIIEKEGPLSVSKLMLICPRCDRPTRIRRQGLENDKRVRACRACGETVDK